MLFTYLTLVCVPVANSLQIVWPYSIFLKFVHLHRFFSPNAAIYHSKIYSHFLCKTPGAAQAIAVKCCSFQLHFLAASGAILTSTSGTRKG